MDTTVLVIVIVAVVVLAAIIGFIAWSAARKRRTAELKDRFGPEYDRTVERADDSRAAEADLEARRERREELDIRPLTPASRDRYLTGWREVQARFVDSPQIAVQQADELVIQVMRERGYPVDDFEQRAADISVDHPHLVEDYRQAHRVSVSNDRGQAETEDLRRAMVHYRNLFEDLLETPDTAGREAG
jgi:FtsZ-interacting cell division protein ZipA